MGKRNINMQTCFTRNAQHRLPYFPYRHNALHTFTYSLQTTYQQQLQDQLKLSQQVGKLTLTAKYQRHKQADQHQFSTIKRQTKHFKHCLHNVLQKVYETWNKMKSRDLPVRLVTCTIFSLGEWCYFVITKSWKKNFLTLKNSKNIHIRQSYIENKIIYLFTITMYNIITTNAWHSNTTMTVWIIKSIRYRKYTTQ